MTEERTRWRRAQGMGPWSAYSKRKVESSRCRSGHGIGLRQADTNTGRVTAEATRIRLELRTVQSGGVWVWPCAGRDFDPCPDSGEEHAYDVLEKAYNMAFVVGDPDRLHRAENEEAQRCECNDNTEHPTMTRRTPFRVYNSTSSAQTVSRKYLRSAGISQTVRSSHCHQLWTNDAAMVTVDGLAHVSFLRAWRKIRLYRLRELAEACQARFLWKISQPGQESRKTSSIRDARSQAVPPSMHSLIDIANGSTDTILNRTRQVALPEILQVADHLLIQLSNFASQAASGQDMRWPHREHRRALSDVTQNMTRWMAKSKFYDLYCDENVKNGDMHLLNPFQEGQGTYDSAWMPSLKDVSFSDCLVKQPSKKCCTRSTEPPIKQLLDEMYLLGWNAIIVSEEFRVLVENLIQVFGVSGHEGIQVIVTELSRIPTWQALLFSSGIKPAVLGDLFRPESPLVIVCTPETLVEYVSVVATLPVNYFVVDVGDSVPNQKFVSSKWALVLSVPCRQRILIVPPTFEVDLRAVVLFIFPTVMCSRRMMMAWNCVSLSKPVVSGIVNVVKLCIVSFPGDMPAASRWLSLLEEKVTSSVANESKILGDIIRNLRAAGVDNYVDEPIPFHTEGDKVKFAHREGVVGFVSCIETKCESSAEDSKILCDTQPNSRSRKRIVRCGKCVGCTASDCMSCGHCFDMKKYGGPGLRKQSCKRRKCVQPRVRGVKRSRTALDEGDYDDSDSGMSRRVLYSSAFSSASDESDDEHSRTILCEPLQSLDEFAYQESDEQSGDDTQTMLVESDTSEDSEFSRPLPHQDLDFFRMRSRVMRCGECAGCTSVDCLKCIHCKDMKKYGGPGLRKQSCKYRKCISPKVVMLNQTKEVPQDSTANRREGVNFDNIPTQSRSTAANYQSLVGDISRLNSLHLVQECLLLVRRFQFFKCDWCDWAFTSEIQLKRHIDMNHKWGLASLSTELCFESIHQHPQYQLACLIASRKMINPNWSPPPIRAYAKLEGCGFEFYVMKTCTVLGRLNTDWIRFYQARGITNLLGLPGGTVDCHVGDDSMIANNQAIVKWDSARGWFTVQCGSFRSVISVNGRDVHYTSHPIRLMSGDLLQIGACTFHFLLPRSACSSESSMSMSRSEVRAWLQQSILKQRATQTQSEAIRDSGARRKHLISTN